MLRCTSMNWGIFTFLSVRYLYGRLARAATRGHRGATMLCASKCVKGVRLSISPRHARYGIALAASFAAAVMLLFAGPEGTAHAVASSNNLETTVPLDTNVASGSNTFTTLAPITL